MSVVWLAVFDSHSTRQHEAAQHRDSAAQRNNGTGFATVAGDCGWIRARPGGCVEPAMRTDETRWMDGRELWGLRLFALWDW